jgi:outer membrane protein insertion porin family
MLGVAAGAWALLAPGLAAAQASSTAAATLPDPALYAGRPIVDVALERGGTIVTDRRWLALIETTEGRPLSMREVRETILHFFHTGVFDSVQVRADPAGPGVRLVYQLVPSRRITGYAFSGDTGLATSELRREMALRFGDRLTPSRSDAAAEALARHLQERGFREARVTTKVEPEGDDRATLRFDVAAGRRATMANVNVTGSPLTSAADVLETLKVAPGEVHDRVELDRRLAELTRTMRRLGYSEASAVAREQPRQDGAVDLTVNVEPGRLVALRFEGDPIPESERAELVPIEREASVDEDLLEDSKRRIERYLKEQGHWRGSSSYRREFTEGRLDVVVNVRAGPVFRVERVVVDGADAISRAEVESLFQLKAGDLYVESAADARTAAVVERYRRAGFRNVRIVHEEREIVQPGRTSAGGRLEIRLAITEGPRTMVRTVQLLGHQAVADTEFRGRLQLQPGVPYYEPLLAADRDVILAAYLDRGYDRVRVEPTVTADADGSVDLTFTTSEGDQLRVDRVLIVGNRRTSVATIEKAMALKPGDPLGLAGLFDSQRNLRALGLFRRVSISDVGEPGETERDLVVVVEEADPTAIGWGGGIEAGRYLRQDEPDELATERLEIAGRGFFEIGRQNLFGSNRAVNLFTRVSLRPSGVPESQGGSGFGFNEYRVLLSFRDPGLFGPGGDARVTGYFEQAVRSSFNFVRRGILAEAARRVGDHVSFAGAYSLSEVRLFDERISIEDRPDIDRLFPQVRISKLASQTRRDVRDDVLDPEKGTLLGSETDFAAKALGSQVGFIKFFGEAFRYQRLPGRRRLVLATGVRIGLARGFSSTVVRVNEDGDPVIGPDGEPVEDEVSDLPASERFFAGGDTTVRGFARDSLGAPGTIDSNGFPTGGNAMMIFNVELRTGLWHNLGGVVFLDAGNVFRRVSDIDLGALRASAGLGFRYKSPVGPVRVDVGFKLDDRVPVPARQEQGYAIHFSIGHAF